MRNSAKQYIGIILAHIGPCVEPGFDPNAAVPHYPRSLDDDESGRINPAVSDWSCLRPNEALWCEPDEDLTPIALTPRIRGRAIGLEGRTLSDEEAQEFLEFLSEPPVPMPPGDPVRVTEVERGFFLKARG